MNNNIGIVIVSHSAEVARSVADMLGIMCDQSINIAHCGGNKDGGLGSDVDQITAAISSAWSDSGVAIFVDLGSTEINSKIAIKRLSKDKMKKVAIFDTPLVEGALTTISIASGGESLNEIQKVLKGMSLSLL